MNEDKIEVAEAAQNKNEANTVSTKNVAGSDEIGKLALALSKAQGEFDIASKDSDNTFYKSKYANIDEVLGAIRPHLAKNELALMQFSTGDIKEICITTRLIHSSGQWIESEISSPPVQKMDIQGQGKAITYLRRYSAVSMLAIAQEDDDGNSSVAEQDNLNITDKQIADIEKMLKNYPAIRRKLIEEYKQLALIPKDDFGTVIKRINKNSEYIDSQK